MSDATVRVMIDADRLSVSKAVKKMARSVPAIVLSHNTYRSLRDELGSDSAVAHFVLSLATTVNKPIGLNFEDGAGRSTTQFVPPRGWSDERVQGWIAGHHRELASLFGEIERVGESS